MSSVPARSLVLRFVAFALAPWVVVYLAGLVYWPSFYFTLPICFPLTAYTYDTALGRYTALYDLWYVLMAAYSLVMGLLVTYFTRKAKMAKAVLAFGVAVATGACLVHVAAHLAGGTFWYDTL